MREIVLDTETTGLDPRDGHRIVEIACIELVQHIRTGRSFHRYVNPERDMPEEALAVHGLTGRWQSGDTRRRGLRAIRGSGGAPSPMCRHNLT